MTKRMLADVLWEAANVRLWPGRGHANEQWVFSCDAFANSAWPDCWENWDKLSRRRPMRWLRSLGCATGNMKLFSEFTEGPKRQGARYIWLLLAMHVAESEGIEI